MASPPSPTAVATRRRRLFTSALSLGARQGLVAALTAIGVLVLSHMLSPAQFAYFGVTTSVATAASAIGDFGLGGALINSGRARELAVQAIARHVRLVIPLTVLVDVAALALPIASQVKLAAVLLSAAAALLGAQMLPTAVFEAEGRFGFIGAIEVAQRAVLIAGAITLASLFHSSWAAPVAALAAAAFGWAVALVTSRVRPEPAAGDELDTRFARSWLVGRVANQVGYGVYPIVGTAFLTARQLGLVLWALPVSAVPGIGGQVVGRVLFPTIATDVATQGAGTYRRAVSLLIAIGGPAVSAMIVFAHPLTALVFGRSWLGALTVLKLECLNTFLGLILTPTAPAIYVLAGHRPARRVMIVNTLATMSLAVALVGPVGLPAISIATAASASCTLLICHLVLRASGHSGLGFVIPTVVLLAACTIAGLLWAPVVNTLPALIAAAGAWTVLAFALVVVVARPPLIWDVLRQRGRAAA